MSDRMKMRRGLRKDLDLKMYEPGIATDERRMYIGTENDPLAIANKEDVDHLNNSKIDLFIGEELPSTKNSKTLYFKVTDTISSGSNQDIKVSPTMSIKEI